MNQRDQAFDDITAELRVMGRRFKQVVHERATAVHPQLQAASYYVLLFLV